MHVAGIITGFHLCPRALISCPPYAERNQALLSLPHDLVCIILELRLVDMSSVSGKGFHCQAGARTNQYFWKRLQPYLGDLKRKVSKKGTRTRRLSYRIPRLKRGRSMEDAGTVAKIPAIGPPNKFSGLVRMQGTTANSSWKQVKHVEIW